VRHFIATILSLAIALAAPAGIAQETPELTEAEQEQLMQTIESGKESYDRGDFQESLRLFRQAYDTYPHPDLLYRIALCHERLGEDQQAVDYYRKFLEAAPEAEERARVERTIEVIEARIARSEIRVTSQPDGAVVYIDDEANGPAGTTPTALAIKPGNYQLIVKKDGYEPIRELVTVDPGQSVQVRYQLTPLSPVSESNANNPTVTDTERPRRTGPSVKLITLATLGIAAGITSFVFFGLHAEKRSELEQLEENRQDVSRAHHDRVKAQVQTNLIVAISTAAVSTFSLIWAYAVFQSEAKARAAAAPKAGPTLGVSNGRPVVGWQIPF
jgi:tetratricopeptide (TPR) repeat protein